VCDFNNKEVQVVIHNTSIQRIDFSKDSIQINLEIWKGTDVQNYIYSLNSNSLNAYTYDTITLITTDFDTGTYNLTAFILNSIDEEAADDTVRRVLAINPDIKIEVMPITNSMGNTDCIIIGTKVNQEVRIINQGNFDVSDIPMVLEVHGGILQTLRDTLKTVLQAGNDTNLFFTQNYTVPAEDYYNVVVTAKLDCDIDTDNNTDIMITECVDWDDIALVELLVPAAGSVDDVGSIINLEVRVENLSQTKTYPIVIINAHITDGIGFDTAFTEVITNLESGKTRDYKFNSSYMVPAAPNYMIKVFVNSEDNYPLNDTLTVTRTNLGTINHNSTSFTLGQNIPNPAKENTRIEYCIPSEGQVIFTVYTITGQTLYVEKKDSYSGMNALEFNTANLAAGIYYYSMEYKGERLVKRMTVRK